MDMSMGTRLLPDGDGMRQKFDTYWVWVWRWGWIFFTRMDI